MSVEFVYVLGLDERMRLIPDLISGKHTERLNQESVLEIVSADKIEKYEHIIYRDVTGRWHEFVVSGVEESHGIGGVEYDIFAESVLTELRGEWIHDKKVTNQPIVVALQLALADTRWQVGTVDASKSDTVTLARESVYSALGKIAEIWEVEIMVRIEVEDGQITGRYIDALERVGEDTGARCEWTHNILDIKRDVIRDDVITALHGYGASDDLGSGSRLDFASINGGKDYLTNEVAREKYGRVGADGERLHKHGRIDFDDITNRSQLMLETQSALARLSQPQVSYQATVATLTDLGIPPINIGDGVTVIDDDLGIESALRVVGIVRDILDPINDEVTLGMFAPDLASSQVKARIATEVWRQSFGQRVSEELQDLSDTSEILMESMVGLNQAYINSMGYYETVITNETTGSMQKFIHDQPALEQSQFIATVPEAGSYMWTNSGWNNGSPVWTYGMTQAGNVLYKTIAAATITASQIYAGIMQSVNGTAVFNLNTSEIRMVSSDGQVTWKASPSNPLQILNASNQLIAGLVQMMGKYGLVSQFISNDATGAGGVATIGASDDGTWHGIWFSKGAHDFKLMLDTSGGWHFVQGGISRMTWLGGGSTLINDTEGKTRVRLDPGGAASLQSPDGEAYVSAAPGFVSMTSGGTNPATISLGQGSATLSRGGRISDIPHYAEDVTSQFNSGAGVSSMSAHKYGRMIFLSFNYTPSSTGYQYGVITTSEHRPVAPVAFAAAATSSLGSNETLPTAWMPTGGGVAVAVNTVLSTSVTFSASYMT